MDGPGTALNQPVRFNIRIRTRLGEATQQYLDMHGRWHAVSGCTAFQLRCTEAFSIVELFDDLVDRGLDVTAIRRAR